MTHTYTFRNGTIHEEPSPHDFDALRNIKEAHGPKIVSLLKTADETGHFDVAGLLALRTQEVPEAWVITNKRHSFEYGASSPAWAFMLMISPVERASWNAPPLNLDTFFS